MFSSVIPLLSLFSSIVLSTATPLPRSSLRRRDTPIIADGRVSITTVLSDFDSAETSLFSPEFVRAANQPFSQILSFPDVPSSLFDGTASRAVEITINDQSIFAPGGNPQNGFRRAELLLASNDGTDATVQGNTTLHFSIQDDPAKPFNFDHEYQLVFIETNDFASQVWSVKTGTPFGTDPTQFDKAQTLRLGSSTAAGPDASKVLFETPFESGVMHNFAIQTDWDKKYVITRLSLMDIG